MAGIYTTSVNEKTIDEAPMAYKSLDDIIDVIRDSVDMIEIMKPVYNFKASDDDLSQVKKMGKSVSSKRQEALFRKKQRLPQVLPVIRGA